MRYPLPVLAFSLCASLSLHAQSFTTNPNFGTNGTTLVNLYNKTTDDFVASGINVTPDGHVLVGGSVYFDACVNTLSPEGIDDVRYGVKGWSFYDFGGWFNNTVHDILRTPDGKTVLIGSQEPCISMDDRYNTDEGAAVMRLLPDGSPDPSFGIAGKAMIFYSGWTIVTFSGLVQPDGKIVLLCRGESGGSGGVWARLMLARIDANGRPDSSFGVNGIALIPQFSGDDHYLLAGNSGIALQADGKIVVGDLITDQIWINYGVGSNTGPAVYRYNPNGVPDSTFGVNGVYSNHLSFYSYGINGVLVQSDGHIVVSAAIIDSVTRNNTGWLLFRLDSSGKKLDSSFANNGLFTYTPDSAGTAA